MQYVKIKINLGNEAMQNLDDVVQTLRQTAQDLESVGGAIYTGKSLTIVDLNGNTVGYFKVKNKE